MKKKTNENRNKNVKSISSVLIMYPSVCFIHVKYYNTDTKTHTLSHNKLSSFFRILLYMNSRKIF